MIAGASVLPSRMAMLTTLKPSITTDRSLTMFCASSLLSIHPGEFLAEILEEAALSQAEFTRHIGVPPMRVSHILKESRPITAELACRFGKAPGQTPQYWLNLQADFDLKTIGPGLAPQLDRIERLAARSA
jgi:addiction module HigA family antidote